MKSKEIFCLKLRAPSSSCHSGLSLMIIFRPSRHDLNLNKYTNRRKNKKRIKLYLLLWEMVPDFWTIHFYRISKTVLLIWYCIVSRWSPLIDGDTIILKNIPNIIHLRETQKNVFVDRNRLSMRLENFTEGKRMFNILKVLLFLRVY